MTKALSQSSTLFCMGSSHQDDKIATGFVELQAPKTNWLKMLSIVTPVALLDSRRIPMG
ncbi:MAG: hypothetical protein RMX35_14165 [Nostoc sp. DcaGUA01]|nr:hypothetical protein [Nostoc sp. DcaGUA01]